MSSLELHNVEDAVDQIERGIAQADRHTSTWSVLGEPTSGKSAVLEQVHQRLETRGRVRSIVVSPPPRAYDAGHAALLDLAEGLSLSPHALGTVRDPHATWQAKVRAVRAALMKAGKIVLLVDEPAVWSPRKETYFRAFVSDMWDLIFNTSNTVVVTAGPTPSRGPGHRAIHLDPASEPESVLAAIDASVLSRAKAVVQARFGAELASISPLQIRLLVAIAAINESALQRLEPSLIEHRNGLVDTLASLVDADHPRLRDLWLRAAALREPFEDDLLGLIGIRELNELESAIAKQCLLFRRRERLVLHESLRTVTGAIDHDEAAVHRLLAAYYRHRFDDPEAGESARLRDSLEAFHHASSAGVVELDNYRPFFVDQLNILGYRLSVEQHERERAADVFRIALEWDSRNAYAAHYRAYNLDLLATDSGQAVDPAEVELLYRQAAEEQPRHPWFRSRLITFLIAEARIDEAWAEWLSATEAIGRDASESVYFGMHLHVARTFLYRGELDHAESILRSLPAEIARDDHFAAISERLGALREARDHGSHVPAPYLTRGWWRRPKLLDEGDLARWLAVRVARVDGDELEFDVADITPGERPVYGALEIPLKTLATWWRGPGDVSTVQAGEFLEIGFYGTDPEARVLAVRHPPTRWPDLARSNEDPDRYLRAAA